MAQDQVLLVDDDVLLLLALEAGLHDGGYQVARALDGIQAELLLDAEQHHIRAVITDIRMPGPFDGWDVARRARELIPDIPVIYITGDSGHNWQKNRVSGSLLFEKPFSADELISAVKKLLSGSSGRAIH
jgi:CheY-like chemotaxis protein